jgi:Leucine-rich repeat (LRR) protein
LKRFDAAQIVLKKEIKIVNDMTKTELKKNITKIKKFLKQRDYDIIDTGIELARSLDEPAVFETLLGGWSINDEGKLVLEEGYQGETLTKRWSDESWPYFAYALVNLIGYAPKNTKVDKSLEYANIKTLSLTIYSWLELPSGLANFTNLTSLDLSFCTSLQNVDGLANLPNLTSLDLSSCDYLQNMDGLANCTNLTSLDFSWCDSLQNLDVLANLTNLTSLDLSSCDYLQNVDGLTNLTKLTSLDLNYCRSLQNVDGLANLPHLTSLDLHYCFSLQNVDGLANLTNLTSLNLHGCSSLQNVDGLANLPNLTSLDLSYCKSLQNVDGLANLTNLTSLDLHYCSSLQNVDGLANLTNLTSLDLNQCSSLQNVDGLANLTNLTSLEMGSYCSSLEVSFEKSKMTTRDEVVVYQDKIRIVMALKNGDMDVFPDYKATAILNLSWCTLLKNVDGLAKCTNLTSLDLRWCKSLQNVEPLIQLQELKVLSMDGCKKVEPLPRPMNMETRSEVESYFRRILKKAGRKIPDSLKAKKTPKGLKSNLAKIKKLILKRDYDTINQGIELLRALDDPAVFESLLAGCSINENGKLMANRLFTGTDPAQPYLDYALVNLIGYAPKDTKVDKSLKHSKLKTLYFIEYPRFMIPWLELPSGLANLTNLTSLDLHNFYSLKNVDGLANLSKLTSLDLSSCDSLQNVDGLANLTNLTSLDLSYCDSLQNVDGLANLPNLSSLDLRWSNKVQPKPSIEEMTTRKEVAAYQEEIKKSMK